MAKEFVGQEYMAATHGKGLHQHSKGMRILGRATITFSVLVTVISVIMVLCSVIFGICPVNGTSMMTTINATGKDTDSAVVCYLGEPERGDIVVAKLYLKDTNRQKDLETYKNDPDMLNKIYRQFPESDRKGRFQYIIKRLIAKPGDIISMCRIDNEYYIYLNGEKLNENYLDPSTGHPNSKNLQQLWKILDENTLNNQDQLKDTTLRDWLSVPYDQCVTPNVYTSPNEGEPSSLMLVIPDDYYFLMGDNRAGLRGIDPETGKTVYFQESWDSTYLGPFHKSQYFSRSLDIISRDTNLPQYLWNQFVYYVCFGWAWQWNLKSSSSVA